MPNSTDATIAVLTSWGRTPDRTARTGPARQALEGKWEREAREEFPDATDEAVKLMAAARKKAHYLRMAKLSAQARKAGGTGGEAA